MTWTVLKVREYPMGFLSVVAVSSSFIRLQKLLGIFNCMLNFVF